MDYEEKLKLNIKLRDQKSKEYEASIRNKYASLVLAMHGIESKKPLGIEDKFSELMTSIENIQILKNMENVSRTQTDEKESNKTLFPDVQDRRYELKKAREAFTFGYKIADSLSATEKELNDTTSPLQYNRDYGHDFTLPFVFSHFDGDTRVKSTCDLVKELKRYFEVRIELTKKRKNENTGVYHALDLAVTAMYVLGAAYRLTEKGNPAGMDVSEIYKDVTNALGSFFDYNKNQLADSKTAVEGAPFLQMGG